MNGGLRFANPPYDFARLVQPVITRGPIPAQIIYSPIMELTLAIILAVVGIASCAIVMAVMWGKEALASRKRAR